MSSFLILLLSGAKGKMHKILEAIVKLGVVLETLGSSVLD
jgi:hypothetical protein